MKWTDSNGREWQAEQDGPVVYVTALESGTYALQDNPERALYAQLERVTAELKEATNLPRPITEIIAVTSPTDGIPVVEILTDPEADIDPPRIRVYVNDGMVYPHDSDSDAEEILRQVQGDMTAAKLESFQENQATADAAQDRIQSLATDLANLTELYARRYWDHRGDSP